MINVVLFLVLDKIAALFLSELKFFDWKNDHSQY